MMAIPKILDKEYTWWLRNITRAEKEFIQKPFCLEIFFRCLSYRLRARVVEHLKQRVLEH